MEAPLLSSPCSHSLNALPPCVSHTPSPHKPIRCPPQVRRCPDAWGSDESDTITALEKVTTSGGRLGHSACDGEPGEQLPARAEGEPGGGKELSRKENGEEVPAVGPACTKAQRLRQASGLSLPTGEPEPTSCKPSTVLPLPRGSDNRGSFKCS